MGNLNSVIRRSSAMVDTSGHMPPVITALRMEGGVYTDNSGNDSDNVTSILQGRISLGIIGILILGAAGFYYYTRSIQGGG
jgi:hypothetical protein